MRFHLRPFRSVLIVSIITLAILRFGDFALAIQNSEEKVLFGPIAVARDQAARLNVYAIGNPDELPWEFAVRIYNRSGGLAQERRFQLAPGVIGSMEISIQDEENFPSDRLGRRTLRAEIVGFNPQPDPPGAYAATLEVYSPLTGRTNILLGGPDTLPAVQR